VPWSFIVLGILVELQKRTFISHILVTQEVYKILSGLRFLRIVVSMFLLFSSSIFGALFLCFTSFTGFIGKFVLFIVGNVKTSWDIDSFHLQIGIISIVGTASFLVLLSQLLKPEVHQNPVGGSTYKYENLIDLD
jgi:hypothetical protein